jgi:hypothetical protein
VPKHHGFGGWLVAAVLLQTKETFGRRAFEAAKIMGKGMFQPQNGSVEAKPPQRITFRSISRVAGNRIAGFGKLDANLMFPAGFKA